MSTASVLPNRRSIRLPDAAHYRQGAYFLTICTSQRACLFGDVVEEQVRLNDLGHIVQDEWQRSAALRQEVTLDAFVVMPNHLHALVLLSADETTVSSRPTLSLRASADAPSMALPVRSLGSLVAGFKAATTRRINGQRGAPGEPVWQRNYWEHIVRDDESLDRIRAYINENPARWALDRENPAVPSGLPQRL